mgnify:CR=1 FL=1
MARLEHVVWRLRNWERWKVSMNGNGLGFARHSAFLYDRNLSDRELRVPVDEVEASITNDAVEALKVPRPRVYEVLQLVYPFGLGPNGASKRMGCALSNDQLAMEAALGTGHPVLRLPGRDSPHRLHHECGGIFEYVAA